MHHFHPPAPKSCIANQQLNSLTACQYLPCSSVAIHNEKEGIETLRISGYVASVRVTPFSAFIHRRYGRLSCDSRISYVVISFCACQGPAFPRCLQLSEGACCALPLEKAGLFLKRSHVRPWVFTVGLSQVKAWISKPRHCPMCVALVRNDVYNNRCCN